MCYEFECPKHGKFEQIISLRDVGEKYDLKKHACPKCGKESRRIYNTFPVHVSWSKWRMM